MEGIRLYLIRDIKNCSERTHGKLYIEQEFVCDTLEPPYMGTTLNNSEEEILATKSGNIAIPCGVYRIDMNTISPKFKNRVWGKKYGGIVPWIVDVPAFERVLIHTGNFASQYDKSDTNGCILVGDRCEDRLVNSTTQYYNLMDKWLIPAQKQKLPIILEII